MTTPRADWTIAYLGPDSPHADALAAFAARRGARFIGFPDSAAAGRYRGAGRVGRLAARARRAWAQGMGRVPAAFLAETLAGLDRHRPTVLLGYWGINPLGDLRAIRRARPRLPLVAVMLCHPSALTPVRVAVQNRILKAALPALSGIVFPSPQMADSVGAVATLPPAAVLRPAWPAAWHAAADQPPADRPTVIFLGRMDGGQPCDNVRRLLTEVADRGVIVHHVADPNRREAHPGLEPFAPRTLPELTAFARRFDAALVTYNTAACRVLDRFDNTIPDRLLSAVAAGVPVALPRDGYAAADGYLANYPAVIRYASADELAAQLRDRVHVGRLRAAAWEARPAYAAEADDDQWAAFLTEVVRGPAGRAAGVKPL